MAPWNHKNSRLSAVRLVREYVLCLVEGNTLGTPETKQPSPDRQVSNRPSFRSQIARCHPCFAEQAARQLMPDVLYGSAKK
jgi:hypothetical protein